MMRNDGRFLKKLGTSHVGDRSLHRADRRFTADVQILGLLMNTKSRDILTATGDMNTMGKMTRRASYRMALLLVGLNGHSP